MEIVQYVNQYRTNVSNYIGFPKDVHPLNMEFYGYVKDNGISKMKGLNLFSFEKVEYSGHRNGYAYGLGHINGKKESIIFKINTIQN